MCWVEEDKGEVEKELQAEDKKEAGALLPQTLSLESCCVGTLCVQFFFVF